VVPLHSPIRIAEEWAVVDNLSNGRVALSVAAGWATPDFAIRPESFDRAKQVMFESTDIVQRLWRGESVTFDGPRGPVDVRTLPRPIQKELPIWVTTAGNVQTFVEAGRRGANVLTHLLGQTFDDVAAKVRAYREARREAGHAGRGIVTILLHTFIGPNEQVVEDAVRQPLKDYLRSATFLVKAAAWQFPTFKRMSEAQEQTLDEFFENISEEDMDGLLEFAFQRYFRTSGLFGTVERGLEIAGQVHAADIDEIACLIDFGIETDTVLAHLPYLDELRAAAQQLGAAIDDRFTLASLLAGGTVSHFQCTPSMARVVLAEPRARAALSGLRQMMVGGEALPPDIAADLAAVRPARVTNMYGPTETTIWSTVGDVTPPGPSAHVPIGRPLAHQTVYVLDDRGAPLPPGVTGELVIGGDGVTRGYWKQPELTAERFLADPFSGAPGARMYRTGDRGRFRPDGDIECLGRVDHQVKIRGHRVEPGEIESLLRSHEAVVEAVVIMREDSPGDQRLVAYLRGAATPPDADTMKAWLRGRLPEVMVPSAFVWLPALPLTPNGKVDRRALPAPAAPAVSAAASSAMPETAAEAMVAEIWQRALNIPSCGTRDNFFDLGGHSLLVVQVLTELRKKVSRPIQMTDLFKYTTIESLARFISAGDTPAAVSQASARASRRRMALERRSR
jgi:natural product biosynthesis luciferase-like monooxygenase protein